MGRERGGLGTLSSTGPRAEDDDGWVSDLRADACAPGLERVRLDGDDVHLWWGRRAGESLEALSGWLSDEERRRCERFRLERDALGFAFRRAFLRSILAARAGCGREELVFTFGPFGKPALARPVSDLRFSASSADAWTLVALAVGRELGVDLEGGARARLRDAEELSRLARTVLTSCERAALARLVPRERASAFLRAWTRKEALLKCLGTGLALDPASLEVGLEPLDAPRELAPPAGFPGQASLVDLAAPPGFAASLVVASDSGTGATRPPCLRVHGPLVTCATDRGAG